MPLPSLEEVKDRKLAQWGLAYLAGGWLVLQVLDIVGDRFGWPDAWLRGLIVVLVIGFFAALVLAWYHGEQGRQRVGGVELGILTALLGLAGLGVMLVGPGGAEPAGSAPLAVLGFEADRSSIAVLPFENVGAADEGYFADGLTDELLATMAPVPGLRVAARTSAFAFKDTDASADSIGRALNVAHLVVGSVRRLGDRVRVSAELVNAETGFSEWAETYERDVTDAFAVQDEIARAVARELRLRVGGDPLAKAQTDDAEAYALFLRGRAALECREGSTAERAVALDPLSIAVLNNAAAVYRSVREPGRAVELYRAGLALAPENPNLQSNLSLVLSKIGDHAEAVERAERAIALDPEFEKYRGDLAFVYARAGRRAEAEQALADVPDDLYGIRASTAWALGDRDGAFDILGRGWWRGRPGAGSRTSFS